MSAPTASLQTVLLRELTTLRQELSAYPDEARLWELPEGLPNSGGTLALHLAGNLQYYIGAVLGSSGYVRDRTREFAARGIPRGELLTEIDAAEQAIRTTLPGLTEARLREVYPEAIRDRTLETGELLLQLAVHLAYHLGQLSYHRRLVTGNPEGVGALDPGKLSTARPPLELPPPM